MEQRVGNAMSLMSLLHHLRDVWKSPRGTVIRIEVLALVAIALSFFLVAFGSCRRWSNRWIIQKGVLAANALSLSLGTYSIGLMQSSSVKSEMYPVWAVSLLTLFGCIDSINAYSLDYNSQLLKLVYQLCLYCGYVLLIGISTISSDVGNIAIGVLSAITFIKGFHRSLAIVLPSRLREMSRRIADYMAWATLVAFDYDADTMEGYRYVVDLSSGLTIDKIWQYCNNNPQDHVNAYKDVCLSSSLCHLLQRRFFGFDCAESGQPLTRDFVIKGLLGSDEDRQGYERAFKVIEVGLAFLYDTFFTSNAFLHHYESKAATIWAFASITGICFVGVAAVIPGTRTSRTSGGTVVVDTTTADLIITVLILASLAFLQVLQLIHCWTSNWARLAFACQYIRRNQELKGSSRMSLKACLTRINWFDNYLWRNKLGQYSLVESISTRELKLFSMFRRCLSQVYSILSRMFALRYIEQVLQEMWGTKTGDPIELLANVKTAIVSSLKRNGGRLTNGSSSLQANLVQGDFSLYCTQYMHHVNDMYSSQGKDNKTLNILTWHIATCYCELAQRKNGFLNEDSMDREMLKDHHSVATTLSKYCAYLVVSAPQLLPGQYSYTKSLCDAVTREARLHLHGVRDKYEAMRRAKGRSGGSEGIVIFQTGVKLGERLEEKLHTTLRWKVLADFWAEMLLYVAPSDNVREHIEHLTQGGEFITHLWALLFHAGIVEREVQHEDV